MSFTPLQSDSIQRLRAWYTGLPHGDQVRFLAGCMLFGAAAVGMLLQPGQAPAGALQANVLGTLNNVNNGLNATVATVQAVNTTVTQTSAAVSGTVNAGKSLVNGGAQTLTGAQAAALANGAGGVVTAVGAAGQAAASPSVYLPNLGTELQSSKELLQKQIPSVDASKQALAARMNTVFDPSVLAAQARTAGQGVRFADPGQMAASMTVGLPNDIGLDVGGLTSRASSLNLTGIADSVQTKAAQLGSIFNAANGAPTIPGIGGLGGISIPTNLNDAAGMAQNAATNAANNAVNDAVNSALAPVAGAVSAAGNIAGTVSGAVSGATAAVSATTGAVSGAVSGVTNTVNGVSTAANGVTGAVNGAATTVTNGVAAAAGAATTVAGAANTASGTVAGFTSGSTTNTASVSASSGATSAAGSAGGAQSSSSAVVSAPATGSSGSSSANTQSSTSVSAETFAALQGKLTYLFPPATDAETNNYKDLTNLIVQRTNASQLAGNILEQTGAGNVAALMRQAGITSSQVAALGGFSGLRAMLLHLETTGS